MDRAGAETMVMNLYRVLDHTKFQFDFLYFTNDKCDFDDEIEGLGGIIYRLSANKYKNPISRMFALNRFLNNNKQIQIIHCHTLFSNAFHLWAGKMAGVKARIVHSHSTSDVRAGSFYGKLYHNFSRFLIKKNATQFISCGEEAGTYLFPQVNNVMILPNSIDTSNFAFIAREYKDYLRNTLKTSATTLIIIQIGRFLEVKNHKFSIELAAYLKSKKVDFKMVFIGDGILRNELENLVLQKQMENEILFFGVRADIPQLLAGSDMMLMPSLYEGFPVALVESQSAGIPALISNIIAKEVDLGVGLVEFLPLDGGIDLWVKKILEIIQRKKLDDNTRLAIIKQKGFNIDENIKILEQLYSRLAGK
jgi:glycosyltransferase EpsF